MKLVTALSGVCLASLLGAAACGGEEPSDDLRTRAQLDIVPGCDGGMSATRDAGDDHEHDAGAASGIDAGSDDDDGDVGDDDAGAPPDPACADLTYAKFGEAFLDKYCVGCHLGSRAVGGIDLSTLSGVREHADHVQEHAVDQSEEPLMPPASARQPSESEREQLGAWLRCGPL